MKCYDEKNDGYCRGQNLVFLLLITESITIPVGFAFYEPDPEVSTWKAKDQILKEDSVKKMNRPKKPLRRRDYPTKQELALNLLTQFFKFHPSVEIKCILADALYGSADFVQKASDIFGLMQGIFFHHWGQYLPLYFRCT